MGSFWEFSETCGPFLHLTAIILRQPSCQVREVIMSYTIPIGPYHPALEEPIHARLTVDGERITDAEEIGRAHV